MMGKTGWLSKVQDVHVCLSYIILFMIPGTSEDGKNMFVFMSPHGRQRLMRGVIWFAGVSHYQTAVYTLSNIPMFSYLFADGTFKAVGAPFAQIYILYVQGPDGGALPCAFGLLSAKTKPLYRAFWNVIRDQCGPDVAPTTLLMDLEQGAYLSFREVFDVGGNAVDIQFCYFHFERALW